MTTRFPAPPTRDSSTHLVLTCVIVAFHRPEYLSRLVTALSDPRVELIIVNVEDDHRMRSIPGALVIPVATNVGYAAGINIGAAAASADIVAFMNDDLELTADDVVTLAMRIHEHGVDVTVPIVIDNAGRPELPEKLPFRLAERMLLQGDPLPVHPTRVDASWAAIVAVRRTVLRSIPVPEMYFLYWEEFDWFFQLRAQRVRVELIPAVRVRHLGGTQVVRSDRSRLMARNAIRCVRRTRGRLAAMAAWPEVIAWQTHLLLASIWNRQGGKVIRAHAAGVASAFIALREI